MKTPESKVKKRVDDYLKAIGAYVIKPATFGFGASGAADRVCCIGGKFVSIEVKREGKVPTPLQRLNARCTQHAGGIAIWGDNADYIIEQLKQALGLPD